MFCFLQQQLTSYQTEKNRLSLTLEERTEQERAEQSKTLERLEQELVTREKAEAAAAEAERERSVLAVDLKDLQQKLERLKEEYNALQDKVRFIGKKNKKSVGYCYGCNVNGDFLKTTKKQNYGHLSPVCCTCSMLTKSKGFQI